MQIVYVCEKCGDGYKNERDCLTCENRSFNELELLFKPGDIVLCGNYRFGWFDGQESWIAQRKPGQSPTGEFYKFYYVITAITDYKHQKRIHLKTLAMSGNQGYQTGYTHCFTHITPELVSNPPEGVVAESKQFIGLKAEHLL